MSWVHGFLSEKEDHQLIAEELSSDSILYFLVLQVFNK